MSESQATIGMPVEQGFYTLILGIIPQNENEKPLYFYNPNDERVNYCTIYGVSMHESIIDLIPTCNIEVEVPYTWLDNQFLTDGTKISIQMKINEELSRNFTNLNEKPYVFRLFNIQKIEDHGLFIRLILGGVIDFLSGYSDGNVLNCPCTTSQVFKNCATKFGFTNTDIDKTSDEQLWIANGRTVYQFLTYCCEFGWVDGTSGMMWAIDRNKKLYYKNIPKCFSSDGSKSGSNCANGKCTGTQNIRVGSLGVPVVTSAPFGLNNIELAAYGTDASAFQIKKDKYDYNHIEAKCVCKTSESTCVCKNGPKKQGENWFPFDVGNHNKNYFKAVLQNRQVLATYSTFLSVRFTPSSGIVAKNSIIPFFEAFHLFDTHNIEYDVHVEDGEFIKMKALTTKCMVETIDVNITQKHAATNIKFVTQGFNTKGNTN